MAFKFEFRCEINEIGNSEIIEANDWNFYRKFDKNKSIRSGAINNNDNNIARDLKQHFFIIRRLWIEANEAFLQWLFIINRNLIKCISVLVSIVRVYVCVRCVCEIFRKASPFPLDTFRCNPWAMTWRQSKCRIQYFNAFVICGPYVSIVRMYVVDKVCTSNRTVWKYAWTLLYIYLYTHNNNTPYTVYLCSIWLNLRIYGLLIFHKKEIHWTKASADDGWKPMSFHLDVYVYVTNKTSIQCVFHSCLLCVCSCSCSSTLSNFLIEQLFRNSSKI